jgi:phytanoyl-CoA hydroxylase
MSVRTDECRTDSWRRTGNTVSSGSAASSIPTGSNTDQARLAYVIIYMDEATTYSGAEHVVTDPLGLVAGDRLDGDTFPRLWA